MAAMSPVSASSGIPPANKAPAEDSRAIVDLRRAGMGMHEVVRRSGYSRMTVYRTLRAAGLVTPQGQMLRRIVRLHKAGYTTSEMAERCGLHRMTVYEHLRAAGLTPNRVSSRTRRTKHDPVETEEEIEAVVAEQMRCLPAWWSRESPPETRQTQSPGRAASAVAVRSRRVCRKGVR